MYCKLYRGEKGASQTWSLPWGTFVGSFSYAIFTAQSLHESFDHFCLRVSDGLDVIVDQRVLCEESLYGDSLFLAGALHSEPSLAFLVVIPPELALRLRKDWLCHADRSVFFLYE